MLSVDRERLLAWLEERGKSRSVIAGAIYAGLAARVRRGEFDTEEAEPARARAEQWRPQS